MNLSLQTEVFGGRGGTVSYMPTWGTQVRPLIWEDPIGSATGEGTAMRRPECCN